MTLFSVPHLPSHIVLCFIASNICLVFVHRSWLPVPRILGVSWAIRAMGTSLLSLVSCPQSLNHFRWNGSLIIPEKLSLPQVGLYKWGDFCKVPKHGDSLPEEPTVNRVLKLSDLTPDLGVEERGWRFNQSLVASNLINDAYVLKPS